MEHKPKKEKLLLMDPLERIKLLSQYSNAVEVDPHIPPKLYYRSGIEMVRMANVYQKEGNLENAYVLYMKFMTLFLEKIRKHPDFAQVPLITKQANQQMTRDILPKAEKLKKDLLEQYIQEHKLYRVIKEKEDAERKKIKLPEPKVLKPNKPRGQPVMPAATPPVVVPLPNLNNINYPDAISDDSVPGRSAGGPTATTTQSTHPAVDRSSKPPSINSLSSTNASGLRTVVIPSCVMTKFLMLAKHNTLSNKETCGILAGILNHNKLIITHMIVPKQSGTSDSCTTTNEEEIFDYQDQLNLITIGWIHTHPTQTAFLSSVDLHTHCPYQLLMPEAIAIVCAPKYNDTGIFVLTPHYGLDFIANCRSTGFHPHPTDPPLFTTAEHVSVSNDAQLEVLDLRKH